MHVHQMCFHNDPKNINVSRYLWFEVNLKNLRMNDKRPVPVYVYRVYLKFELFLKFPIKSWNDLKVQMLSEI